MSHPPQIPIALHTSGRKAYPPQRSHIRWAASPPTATIRHRSLSGTPKLDSRATSAGSQTDG